MQGVLGTSTSILGVGGSIPSTPSIGKLTSSFSGSSQASSIDIPTGPTPGLCHLHVSVYLLTLITAPVVLQLPPVTVNQAELVLSPDTNGLMLTMQHPLVRLVIWDSFDILCALLIFINVFPNAPLAIRFVKEALLNSALRHTPGANNIYQQLMHDKKYTHKIILLVSHTNAHDCFCWNYLQPRAQISIFQHKVKEYCCAIIEPAMLAIGEQAEVVRFVERQLWSYIYMFLLVLHVSNHLTVNFILTFCCQVSSALGLVRQMLPYCNNQIITAIWDLFFSGGTTSFAMCYRGHFAQVHKDSSVSYEVPMPLVALVATGVSWEILDL